MKLGKEKMMGQQAAAAAGTGRPEIKKTKIRRIYQQTRSQRRKFNRSKLGKNRRHF